AKWYFNGKLIEAGERFETAEDENCFALEINPALKEDQVPKSFKEPVFLEELRAVLTEAGTVSLEVKVVGIPTPVLKWFKGDLNAKIGADRKYCPAVLGPHGLGQIYENGELLVDFALSNALVVGGTLFEHKNVH
ncbi:hypothetical protein QYM36_002571, partial [Artemia franciscana]